MPPKKTLSRSKLYTIGWITALPSETAAAKAMFDELHDQPDDFQPNERDENTYNWGQASGHNVVIASLPAGVYGTNSAAITASQFLSSLPHIKIGLLVGIGGGIPRLGRDIRLGDVAVSQPCGTTGGVVQYDLGKAKTNDTWEQKGSLNSPPRVLLTALADLQSEHDLEGPKFIDILRERAKRYPNMERNCRFPGAENDRLFSSEYQHVGGTCDTCDTCDPSQQVTRAEREESIPVVHYGIIASGNTLVKDAVARDAISARIGDECICVEMEASGLVNDFPCLVIRGICDYADSHKNDGWQKYAAITAAAFAVELLGRVRVSELQRTPRAVELMGQIYREVTTLTESVKTASSIATLASLEPVKGAAHDSRAQGSEPVCLENTRVHLLDDIQAWAWRPDSATLFWLNGMAGTGKSTISRTISRRLADSGILGASFFFKRGETDRSTPSKLFTTLAAGLARRQPAVSGHLVKAIEENPQISDQNYNDQFEKLILGPLAEAGLPPKFPIVMVVDALDECQDRMITSIIANILPRASDLESPQLKFFLTGRPDHLIQEGFSAVQPKSAYRELVLHNVSREVVKKDLDTFLTYTLADIRDRYNTQRLVPDQLPPAWPGNDIIQILVDMSAPLFVVASTLCRFVGDRNLGTPKQKIKLVLAMEDREHEYMIDDMYLTILKQQLNGCHRERQQERVIAEFRQIVGSIVLLSTPLTIPALARLLQDGESHGDDFQAVVQNRLDGLRSVLSVPQLADCSVLPVEAFHLSFRDFLVDRQYRNTNRFWVDEAESHAFLSDRCLRVLKASLRRDMCELKFPGVRQSALSQETVDHYLPPELRYACLYWIDHLQHSVIDSVSVNVVLGFLKTHLLHWLEAMSLIGRAYESLSMIETLQDAITKTLCPELLLFLDDAARFIRKSVRVIAATPLQVYSSALVFAPHESRVRKVFDEQIPTWISLQPRVEDHWDSSYHVLTDLRGSPNSLAFSPNSKLLAGLTCRGSEVAIWQVNTGKCLRIFRNRRRNGLYMLSSDWNLQVVFTTDSAAVVVPSPDRIQIWRIDTGQVIHRIEPHGANISSMTLSNQDLLACGLSNGVIQIWEATTGLLRLELDHHEGGVVVPTGSHSPARGNTALAVTFLSFSPDQRFLASMSKSSLIRIWRTDPWASFIEPKPPKDDERTLPVAFSADSKLIASATPGVVSIWSSGTGQLIRELSIPYDFDSLMFCAGPAMIVWHSSRQYRSPVSVWDATSGDRMYTPRDGGDESVESSLVASSVLANHPSLAVWGRGQKLQVWQVDTGTRSRHFSEHFDRVSALAMAADASWVASGDELCQVRIWRPSLDADPQEPEGPPDNLQATYLSPDLRLAVHKEEFADESGGRELETYVIWETETRRRLQQFHIEDGYRCFMFSPDSKRLLTYGNRFLVWEIKSGKELLARELPLQAFPRAAFSSTSELVVLRATDQMEVWNLSTAECICEFTLDGSQRYHSEFSFSADSKKLLSGGETSISVWDVTNGQHSFHIDFNRVLDHRFEDTRSSDIQSLAFARKLDLIVVGFINSQLHVLDATTGDTLTTIRLTHPSDYLSFEANDTEIQTNRGLYPIGSLDLDQPRIYSPVRIGINRDRSWIRWGLHRLIHLPNEYLTGMGKIEVRLSSVFLSDGLNRASLMKFDAEELAQLFQ